MRASSGKFKHLRGFLSLKENSTFCRAWNAVKHRKRFNFAQVHLKCPTVTADGNITVYKIR